MELIIWAVLLVGVFGVEEEKKTNITFSPCPDTCACTHSEDGSINQASCKDSNPEYIFSMVPNTKHLIISGCSEPLTDVNITTQSVGFIESLLLDGCLIDPSSVKNFKVFFSLARLEILNTRDPDLILLDCNVVKNLELINFSGNGLTSNPILNCSAPFLRNLNLSENSLSEFDFGDISGYRDLIHLDLSANPLLELVPTETDLSLTKLLLRDNRLLRTVCSQIFRSTPNLKHLDISFTNIQQVPLGLILLKNIEELGIEGWIPTCDCQTAVRLQSVESRYLYTGLQCLSPVSGTKFNFTAPGLLNSLDCGEIQIQGMDHYRDILVGSEILLDCPVVQEENHETFWLSPRHELLRLFPDQGSCPSHQDKIDLSDHINAYSSWENHYTILENGSLLIDQYGWRDRGQFRCYVDNGVSNSTETIKLSLNIKYRNNVYYMSLAYGFAGAVAFLGLTLLGKLVHYILWNYGCCLCCRCCSCCKDQLPPKTKKLTKVVDSIETYRIQQLEKLRENYNQQSQRIRDNCTLQMEKVRENYNTQAKSIKEMKTYGSAQCTGVKDQYFDQITKIREYSSGQLDRCHENYIFQRQRLRKFSAQNYLKIRETKQYTQKTLNRVLDNMPALYLDLSSCRQGYGDQDLREWQEEMDKREAEMKDILDIEKNMNLGDMALSDSQSLYYTPTETPMRDLSLSPLKDGGEIEVARSPEKSKKGHKRMVSNISNLLPFWWGNQQGIVETVAIVENTGRHNEPTEMDQLLQESIQAQNEDDGNETIVVEILSHDSQEDDPSSQIISSDKKEISLDSIKQESDKILAETNFPEKSTMVTANGNCHPLQDVVEMEGNRTPNQLEDGKENAGNVFEEKKEVAENQSLELETKQEIGKNVPGEKQELAGIVKNSPENAENVSCDQLEAGPEASGSNKFTQLDDIKKTTGNGSCHDIENIS